VKQEKSIPVQKTTENTENDRMRVCAAKKAQLGNLQKTSAILNSNSVF
jgi:hypothetical protein